MPSKGGDKFSFLMSLSSCRHFCYAYELSPMMKLFSMTLKYSLLLFFFFNLEETKDFEKSNSFLLH